MPNVPPWPALMVSRGITKRTKLTVGAAVGTVTDHPACVKGLYSTLGIDAGTPLNSLATYDDLGNLLAFESEQFDGTNLAIHWKDSYAAADADRYLYWDPTVDPGSSLADPTAVWSNGYAAVWHMGDAGPTTVADSLGVNNGVQSGGVTFGATGQVGKCISLDGGDDYVDAGSSIPFDSNNWTLDIWANWSGFGGYSRLISYYGDGPTIWKAGWSNPNLYIVHSGTIDYSMAIALVADTWQHIVVTRNGLAIRSYLNGSEVSSNLGFSTSFTADTSVRMGNSTAYNDPFWGLLDEVSISSVARSATWVAAETLFRLGTAVTVGAVETYQPPGGLPLILGRAGRSGPSLAGLRC